MNPLINKMENEDIHVFYIHVWPRQCYMLYCWSSLIENRNKERYKWLNKWSNMAKNAQKINVAIN